MKIRRNSVNCWFLIYEQSVGTFSSSKLLIQFCLWWLYFNNFCTKWSKVVVASSYKAIPFTSRITKRNIRIIKVIIQSFFILLFQTLYIVIKEKLITFLVKIFRLLHLSIHNISLYKFCFASHIILNSYRARYKVIQGINHIRFYFYIKNW